jgi:sirohydrochlorin ferrochelatase
VCRRTKNWQDMSHRPKSVVNWFQGVAHVEDDKVNPHLLNNRVLGVVVVDHGSRREEANRMLEEFADLFMQVSKHEIVEIAHMELAEPSIRTAVLACVRRGATHVVLAPYFLSKGRHVQTDIPRIAQEVQQEVEHVPIQVADPIGALHSNASISQTRISSKLWSSSDWTHEAWNGFLRAAVPMRTCILM